MISKETYQFVMNRISNASNGELLAFRDTLEELLRHPISLIDRELHRDIRKSIKKINEEMDARYDLYLSEQRTIKASGKKPVSASVVPIRPHRSGV